jgi:hypothetical protein
MLPRTEVRAERIVAATLGRRACPGSFSRLAECELDLVSVAVFQVGLSVEACELDLSAASRGPGTPSSTPASSSPRSLFIRRGRQRRHQSGQKGWRKTPATRRRNTTARMLKPAAKPAFLGERLGQRARRQLTPALSWRLRTGRESWSPWGWVVSGSEGALVSLCVSAGCGSGKHS